MKTNYISISILMAMTVLLASCGLESQDMSSGDQVVSVSQESSQSGVSSTGDEVTTSINLSNPTATEGVAVSTGLIEITRPGSYTLSGEFNGQVQVEVGDEDEVTLVLSGVTITNEYQAAIAVLNAKDTYIELAAGTTNTLTDGSDYNFDSEDTEPNATLFSKDDLHIEGAGALIVNANYNDGISSKDDLEIESGNITVNAVDDGLRGKQSVEIKGGNLSITAQGDAIKADDEAEGAVIIEDGDITLAAGDDGIHAEIALTVNGGNLVVTESYEGLESLAITISGGYIDVTSSDDGFNVAGGVDSSGEMGGGRMPGGMESASEDQQLIINGGTIVINAQGDGLDSNGYMTMNGGDVIVYGPTNDGNGPLDYNGTFSMNGGSLIAIGSSGMAQSITADVSTQNAVLIGFTASQAAGTTLTLKDSSGNIVAEVTGEKSFASAVISDSDLEIGQSYTYYLDGVAGETFTLDSQSTTVGTVGRMGGGGGGRGGFGMNQSINYNGELISLQTLKDIEDKVEYNESLTSEEQELYEIYVLLDEAMDKVEYGETLTAQEQEAYELLVQNTQPEAGAMMGGMNQDFEAMRTIMDKVRSGETLTSEEQELYDEFESNRPQRPEGGMMPPIKKN